MLGRVVDSAPNAAEYGHHAGMIPVATAASVAKLRSKERHITWGPISDRIIHPTNMVFLPTVLRWLGFTAPQHLAMAVIFLGCRRRVE